MSLDMEAIFKAYAGTVTAIDSAEGCFDADGNKVTIDQTLVDAARVELDKLNYRTDRTTNGSTIYASFGDQLDMLYADIVAGKLDTTGTWATHIKAVKDANPKP
tara:strand:+ start:543 stop:854 length:312 start_codon:yes stop_codon:yes gene_type:complete